MADRIDPIPPSAAAPPAPPAHVSDVQEQGGVARVTVDPSMAPEQAPQNNGEPLLAGKFKSPADLERAYKELESRLGKPQETPKGSEAPKGGEGKPVDAKAAVEKAGLDMAALNREFAEAGSLGAESLAKLEAAGITKAQVDAFVAGQKAIVEQYDQKLYAAVGGQEKLQAILQWAGSNLTAEEVTAVNEQLATLDEAKGKLAVEGLASRYAKAMGSDPKLVNGESVPTRTGVQPFKSDQEMADAMANPKYRTDPAYQQMVMDRMAVSNVFSARVL